MYTPMKEQFLKRANYLANTLEKASADAVAHSMWSNGDLNKAECDAIMVSHCQALSRGPDIADQGGCNERRRIIVLVRCAIQAVPGSTLRTLQNKENTLLIVPN